MKFNRKHLTTLLATLLLATVSHSASAYFFMVDGIAYTKYYDKNEVYVTFQNETNPHYDNLSGAVTIPSYVKYNGVTYPVTGIGYNAFRDITGITRINLPNTITIIETSAFSGCTGLTSVSLGSSLKYIEDDAFKGCSKLSNISIPNSVIKIKSNAFYGTSITSITIPSSVTFVGKYAFYCTNLIKVTWNAKNCEDFEYNSRTFGYNVKEFVIGDETNKVPLFLCQNLSALESLSIGKNVTSIGNNSFDNCQNLKTVTWNVKSFSDFSSSGSPLSSLTGITTFIIGDDVTKIPSYLCSGLSNINSVTIGKSVTTISNYAFNGCNNVKTLVWNAIKCNSIGYSYMPTSNIQFLTIGNTVQSLPDGFVQGSKISSIVIPNSVMYIGNSVFSNCRQLTSVVIPNSVSIISPSLFSGCINLVNVTIPNTITSIGSSSFSGCSNLTSINIPSSVTSIADKAFSSCSHLTRVNISDLAAWCKISFFSVTSNPLYYSHHLFLNNNEVKELVLPNTITSINNNAFSGGSGFTKVSIPNSVTSIGSNAFLDCTGLTGVYITDLAAWCKISFSDTNASPLYLAHHLFLRGEEVVNLVLPNTVTVIGNYSFAGCTSMTSVSLPNTLSSIGSGAFLNCSALKYVFCKRTTPPVAKDYLGFSNSVPILIPNGTMTAYKNANYWKTYNLRYSLTKIISYIAQASVTSEDNKVSHVVNIKVDNKDYNVNNDAIVISGLKPYEEYLAIASCTVLGEARTDSIIFITKPVKFGSLSGTSTQVTISPKFKVYRDDAGFSIQSSGVSCNGKDYRGRIVEETDAYYIVETTPISGLTYNTTYYYTPWIVCNGKRCEGPQYNIITKNIGVSSHTTTGPTNVEMTGSYNAGDAHVSNAYFTFYGQQMKKISVTGLKPSTSYATVYTVVTNNGNINTNMSFTTKSLTMTTQDPHMLSDTSPMFIATTNIADVETSCGFEWRRYDAPAEMSSTKVYCPVYGGTMAGVLKNMSPNVYYKYRPFYKASDGTEYYGDWKAFITADANVTFEPVVYTYKSPEVTQNTAILQGVALPGSSEITEQGFEYWRLSGSKAPTGTVKKVTATGQRMSATVEGLSAGANYGFRSYVKSGGKTYYGSEEQFTTETPSGDVNGDGKVNVSDVSALINMILGITPMDQTTGDVNGDGRVNVSDVSALINIILGIQ